MGKSAISILSLLLAVVAAQEPKPPSYPDIVNFLRVNPLYCTGGQPSLDDLARLHAEGVRAILNLRMPTENFDAAAEEAKAHELGLRYFTIPVDSHHPTDENAAAFLKFFDNPQNRPAFIHCGTANRVGAFWMIQRVLKDGWSVEEAEREAERIGLRGKELREFAHDYIRRHTKGGGPQG